ncbi:MULTISPECIES: aminomethyl-transferring glycine dehydrogenase [Luteococcus]|uniref:Glycine dehydrogenase (decarboxylating) n=1 Tax=Luteococcus japonicus LSP_Lj1 TaxID=1255658 RepID=A0A1R4K455_9ACTN|nr:MULTISPECIES: aminomethyl-transferring glycine dehydrogenase [Luteococcus]MDN5563365.1 aminomethyl-transferring glycine dehydrogenase [Luteococcus sp.]SJN39097.1 Glycine dehydrogenase [decarboxylating] (glycine cleavage system P protein) [Luteococcus japonicus LSP_Lj1]
MVTTASAHIFSTRHIGPSDAERREMLEHLGLQELEDLAQALPAAIRMDGPLDLPEALTESAVLDDLRALSEMNHPKRAMIGLGYHGTITPPVVRRNVLEDPAWYTAYTPYQPEISQGRLEALLNFQTMVSDLTGLPTAGASLLDEATAVAEAVGVARRTTRKGNVVLLDAEILPQSAAVVRTRAAALGWEVVEAEDLVAALQQHEAFCVVVQLPGASGVVRGAADLRSISDKAHENGATVVAAADLLALTRLESPASWGADIAVGSTQRFGVPLFYGGPHAGYISVRAGLERSMPGRLVGVSVDADGTPAYRLALQTREQHIRREKATSNICTAQVLLAVTASMYAVYHGPEGLRSIADQIHGKARMVAAALRTGGFQLASEHFFDTLTVAAPGRATQIVAAARDRGVHLRQIDADHVGISVGEDSDQTALQAVAEAFGVSLDEQAGVGDLAGHQRGEDYLLHPVFNSYHSETLMLRYLRALSDRDFALDRGMIPLGSCTMKLNATAEMEPISYPGFANLHPFCPLEDAKGYAMMIERLGQWLEAITGYDRVSLQPNSGAAGEYAGLMAIRSYHLARGDEQRTICLIPSSAHGTNAASAAMAGMKVVVVRALADGSIDMDDLRAQVDKHRDQLAAIMVTYPSTHGVYEDTITELSRLVHEAGGQVYVDGANMNALAGLAQPGRFGGDVSHLNLHKTFAIPHGGGGPGVGPIGVREHLAPYLPNHPLVPEAGPESSYGPVAGAPWGSAGVMPISYAYIAMMGAQGLREATLNAILNANYIGKRLEGHFPVLYAGADGRVAHECILDLRGITKTSHVTVDDVAKRLIDYGFHAPTMSFPVAGTLMVEPTESESKYELDRFCDAMLAIRREIAKVEAGEWEGQDNPLANAPHTLARVTADEWTHPYSRSEAGYPAGRHAGPIAGVGQDKYWPAVARIDGVHGDRNLVCSCPPIESYQD